MPKKNLGGHLSSHNWSLSFWPHIRKWKKDVNAVWKKKWRQLGTYGVNGRHQSFLHVSQGLGPDDNNHQGMAANSPWGMDHGSTNGWAKEEVPILPVQVKFVRTKKYNIAMVHEFCWPSIKQVQRHRLYCLRLF